MTKIHVRTGQTRTEPKAGDRKMIKGIEHVRCFVMVNIGTPFAKHYAYLTPNGRQKYKWVPVSEADLSNLRVMS